MRPARTTGTMAVIAGATLAVTLTACGSGSTTSAPPGGGPSYNAMNVADLAKAAKSEGTLTWYVAIGADDVDPIIKAFNQTYPDIQVKALRLSADQIPPRVMTEQRGQKFNADVITGDALQVVQLVHANALQPYTPPDEAPLPSGVSLPQGYRGVSYANTTAIAYNPSRIKKLGLPAPTSWEDLAKPAWRGQFTIDPSAVNWYDSLIHTMGHDKALDLLKRLGDNDPVPVESHSEAMADIASGEPAAGATIYGYMAAPLAKTQPDQVALVNPNPLPVSLNLTDIARNAPHPAAARLFDDWLVSQAGQQKIIDLSDDTSTRTDVKNDASVWNPQEWKPAWSNPTLSPADYNAELAEMKSALHVA